MSERDCGPDKDTVIEAVIRELPRDIFDLVGSGIIIGLVGIRRDPVTGEQTVELYEHPERHYVKFPAEEGSAAVADARGLDRPNTFFAASTKCKCKNGRYICCCQVDGQQSCVDLGPC